MSNVLTFTDYDTQESVSITIEDVPYVVFGHFTETTPREFLFTTVKCNGGEEIKLSDNNVEVADAIAAKCIELGFMEE